MTTSNNSIQFARSGNISAVAASAAVCVAAVLTVLLLVPFGPIFPDASLDSSWMYALNVAVAERMQFGRDIVFTFGPLASAYSRQYHPATDGLMLAVCTLLATAIFLGFRALAGRDKRGWMLMLPLVLSMTPTADSLLIGLPLLILFVSAKPSSEPILQRVAVVVGMAALGVSLIIKGSTIPTVLFCSAGTVAILWTRSRTLAVGSVVALALAMGTGWVAGNQELANLPHFFVAQGPIISGYTDAMSMDGAWSDLFIYAGLSLAVLWSTWRLRLTHRWVTLAAAALVLFLCFKAGFVRHDAHTVIAGSGLLFLAFTCILVAPSVLSIATLALVLAGWGVIMPDFMKPSPANVALQFSQKVHHAVSGALDRARGGQQLKANFKAANDNIRAATPLSAHSGSVDLYPSDLSVLLANAGRWSPRPVLQSYSAYTPSLAQQNATHLRLAGPEQIFFTIAAIDQRYPSAEDGLSWLSLLSQYRPTGIESGYLVLNRTGTANALELDAPVREASVPLGQSIDVPDVGTPVFVQIDVKPKLLGKAATIAFKSPQLRLVVEYPDGEKRDYRYIAGMGHTGFVLSPTVTTAAEFAMLRTPQWKSYLGNKMPLRIGIVGDSGTRIAWKRTYGVKFYKLKVPTSPEAEAAIFPTPKHLPSLAGLPRTESCNIETINTTNMSASPVYTTNAGLLNIAGWGAVSAKEGIASEKISLAVVNADGSALLFPMPKRFQRTDVVKAFGHNSLLLAGFEGTVNTFQAKFPAEIRLVQHLGPNLYLCERSWRIER